MHLTNLILIAVGLSMDAFAVSICKGLSVRRVQPRHSLICGLYFGGFQGLMPLIGWLLGVRFQTFIARWDHWIAFVLLSLIGWQMIREGGQDTAPYCDRSFSPSAMLPLAVATSIDALAVGVTFAFLQVEILPAVSLIALTTCLLSALGVWLGAKFGGGLRGKAERLGGILLIAMGVHILLEHLGLI